MARKQKPVAQLWEEITGKELIVAYVNNGERRRGGIGSTTRLFSFSEVLELTGFPRGRVEDFISRAVLELQAHDPNPGSVQHRSLHRRNRAYAHPFPEKQRRPHRRSLVWLTWMHVATAVGVLPGAAEQCAGVRWICPQIEILNPKDKTQT